MNGSRPLVSICMPLFNTERYVAEAIECVLRQTYNNLELIVCDNCSTDRSLDILEESARRDARIRVFRNRRNLGYAGNLHKVTSLARGQFMMVHCADDLSAPTGVEELVSLATSDGVDPDHVMAAADWYLADASGKPTRVYTLVSDGFVATDVSLGAYEPSSMVRRFRGRPALAYALPRLSTVGFQGATLYSRTLFSEIEGLYAGLDYSPDALLNYYLLSRDPEVLWLRQPLFFWRVHEGGQSAQARSAAVPKAALDAYSYTYRFSPQFLDDLGIRRKDIVRTFIDIFCLRAALSELRVGGSTILALRHLFFGLATYPRETLTNLKFYAAALICATGAFGRALARACYRLGVWRPAPRW